LPIEGDGDYTRALGQLIFGQQYDPKTLCGVQAIGGTGALYLAGRLATHWTNRIAISQPTWANHFGIFTRAGLNAEGYPYYAGKTLIFNNMLEALAKLPPRTCVLLHTNCHNPTGFDLSKEQWQQLLELVVQKKLYPIFDMAYQGFSDEPLEDSYAPLLFMQKEVPFALSYTCSKNFSIYAERAGALFVYDPRSQQTEKIEGSLKSEIRSVYSNPPFHAAAIVKTILNDPTLKQQWLKELAAMRARMKKIRTLFIDQIIQKDRSGNWEPCRVGRGLFLFTEISPQAVQRLREEKGIYLASDGRCNLTGLNEHNLNAFIDALVEVK
jgi:aromatic-amino-acid transaminase